MRYFYHSFVYKPSTPAATNISPMSRSPILICATALLLALILCPAAAAENKSPMDHFQEGCNYYELRQYTKALASFDQAVELEPEFLMAWYNRGVILQERGKYQDALDSYDRAFAISPHFLDLVINRGIVQSELDRHVEAVESFQWALRMSPHSAEIWNTIGSLYSDMGLIEEAMDAFEMSISLDPNYALPWDNIGRTLITQGRYEEALAAFEEGLARDPMDEELRRRRDMLKERLALREMVVRWTMIGGVVGVGYVGFSVWRQKVD